MKYNIDLPLSLYMTGRRANQEDALYPSHGQATRGDRVFVVCDGIGGHDNGEVASAAVATAIGQSINSSSSDEFGIERFNHAMNAAYYSLDAHDIVVAGKPKMGTTMAMLYLYRDGAFVAHMGDCRVYHVRPATGQVVFRTEDHTLVNELFRAHRISAEALENQAEKNVVTRAMLAHSRRQPAETAIISDIREGDLFFVCSHGMFSGIKETEITQLLVQPDTSPKEKILAIKELTANVIDNHSCYLITIREAGDNVTEAVAPAAGENDDVSEVFTTDDIAAGAVGTVGSVGASLPGEQDGTTDEYEPDGTSYDDPWAQQPYDHEGETEHDDESRSRDFTKWLPLIIAAAVFALAIIGGLVWYFGYGKGTGATEKPLKGGYLEEVSLTDISKDTTHLANPNVGSDSINMPPVGSAGGPTDVRMPRTPRVRMPNAPADPLDGFGVNDGNDTQGENDGNSPNGNTGDGNDNNTGNDLPDNDLPAAGSGAPTYGTNPPARNMGGNGTPGGTVAKPGSVPPPRKKRDPNIIPTAPNMP